MMQTVFVSVCLLIENNVDSFVSVCLLIENNVVQTLFMSVCLPMQTVFVSVCLLIKNNVVQTLFMSVCLPMQTVFVSVCLLIENIKNNVGSLCDQSRRSVKGKLSTLLSCKYQGEQRVCLRVTFLLKKNFDLEIDFLIRNSFTHSVGRIIICQEFQFNFILIMSFNYLLNKGLSGLTPTAMFLYSRLT